MNPSITPYYQDEFSTIYCGDWIDVLRDEDLFDLLLTDPPYGIGIAEESTVGSSAKTSELMRKRGFLLPYKVMTEFPIGDWDNEAATEKDLKRIEAACIAAIVWGGNYFSRPTGSCWFIWDKCRRDLGFADGEMARTSFNGPMRICTYRWNGMLQGKLQCNSRDKEKRWHPAQKPLHVMQWCINQAVMRSDKPITTILDPYMGSGSTLVAAKLKGIHCTGIEQSEEYCEIAKRRLQETSVLISIYEAPRSYQGALFMEETNETKSQ